MKTFEQCKKNKSHNNIKDSFNSSDGVAKLNALENKKDKMKDAQKKIREELAKANESKFAKQTDAELSRGEFLSNLAKDQVSDPAWQEANKLGASKRKEDSAWQRNHKKALDKINANDEISKKRKKKIKEVTSSDEWKTNQLHGTRTKRAKNENWQVNVRAGAQKREDDPEFKKRRKEINGNQKNNPNWINNVRKGVKDRWNKEENLSTCPHCGKKTDNANYKRWHGDNCKMKGTKK